MPPRLLSSRALGFSWAALASLLCFGCSSDGPRDLNYGTDAGFGYVPSDPPVRADAAPDSADAAPDSEPDHAEGGMETAAVLDGASPYDASGDAISGDSR